MPDLPDLPPAARRLRAASPGQRWVARVRLPDGSATDRTGWVDAVGSDAVTLVGPVDARRSPEVPGARWVLPWAQVLAARAVGVAAGGPAPARTSAAELEHLAAPAWAGDVQPLGEWRLRSAGGFTGRANSCLAVGDPGRPVAEAAAAVEAYAAAAGIAPVASVVTGSAEDAALRDLGWTETGEAADVLAVGLADLLEGRPVAAPVDVSPVLDPAWRSAYDLSRPFAGDPAAVTAVLEGRPPRAFAAVRADGRVLALARGHLGGSWLGVAGVWTRPEERRRGLATALVLALGHWAARRGARYAYLQVGAGNAAAHQAYARLGFGPHHRYHYLAAPSPHPEGTAASGQR